MDKEQELPLIVTRNELARFTEYLNEDVPTVVRDIHAGVAILLDLDTRRVVGYRVYDINEGWRRSSDEQAEVAGYILPKNLAEDVFQYTVYRIRSVAEAHAEKGSAVALYASPPAVAAGGVTEERVEAALEAYRNASSYPIVPGNHAEAMRAALTSALAVRDEGIRLGAKLKGPIKLDIAGSALFVSKVQADALLTIAAPLVEELSRRPQTHWGEIVAALREKATDLAPPSRGEGI